MARVFGRVYVASGVERFDNAFDGLLLSNNSNEEAECARPSAVLNLPKS